MSQSVSEWVSEWDSEWVSDKASYREASLLKISSLLKSNLLKSFWISPTWWVQSRPCWKWEGKAETTWKRKFVLTGYKKSQFQTLFKAIRKIYNQLKWYWPHSYQSFDLSLTLNPGLALQIKERVCLVKFYSCFWSS